jgi:hypothetical protein
MRVVKIYCVLACLSCVAQLTAVIHAIRSSPASSTLTGHTILGMISLLVVALVCAVEFYGIHAKAPFAWTLGWVMLAATFADFLVVGGSAALNAPKVDYPWVAFVAVVIGGSLVALYWGLWWKRQKRYFTAQPLTNPNVRAKELVVVFCVAALAFGAIRLLSGQTVRYQELVNPALKQFREQFAAEQYIAIYEGADETLRGTTRESDFVNLLESVHEKLGDVQNSNLTFTGISWHGNHNATISLNYKTEFARGAGTEKFMWQDHNNRVTLGRYQVYSKVLTER